MSTPVSYLGVTYFIPAFGDGGYAQGAGNLSLYLIALANGSLTTSGGIFTLTGDVNFGSSFGVIAPYYKSASANIATSGVLRMSNTDSIQWRNFANSGNDVLAVNASDQLTYNGTPIGLAGGSVTSVSGTANQINSTGGNTPILSLSSTVILPGTITLGGNENAAGFKITGLSGGTTSGDSVAMGQASWSLAAGSLTGTLAMGGFKITGLATGTAATDAANVGQTVTNPLTTNLAAGGNKITGLANGTAAQDAVAFTQLTTGNAITGGGITSSVALAGSPTTTTQVATDSSTNIATTAFVQSNTHVDLLGTITASGSVNAAFTGLAGAKYAYYEVIIDNLQSATDAVSLRLQLSTGSGFGGSYSYENLAWAGTTSSVTSATGQTSWDIMDGAGTGTGVIQSLKVTIYGADNTTIRKRATWSSTGFYQSGLFFTTAGGGIESDQFHVIDGIGFSMSTGNIATGTFRLYGYRNT